jgi:hypothetical protein
MQNFLCRQRALSTLNIFYYEKYFFITKARKYENTKKIIIIRDDNIEYGTANTRKHYFE